MFKKSFLFITLFSSLVLAGVSQTQVINAVKANPALLNTPQAKAEMAKRGISKSEVLSKINNTTTVNKNNTDANHAKNKVDLKDNSSQNKVVPKKLFNSSASINPLKYKENYTLLKEIKSKQSIKKRKNLTRYGLNFFRNKNTLSTDSLPVPSYYVLGYGDGVSIWVYGTKNENFTLKIDNNGNINLPKYGPLHVVGKQFGEIEGYIKEKLKNFYSNSDVIVNISSYSTIQVNLVGDVVAPGVYNVNALSTVKNLLIASHGVKDTGSLRNIIIKRDGKILDSIDFYRLLQNGDESLGIILRSNDTIFVPKANKIVSIDGEVNNPAKFELKSSETLANLVKYAGGIKASASRYGFIINRYLQNKKMKTIEVDYNKIRNFRLLNNDRVYVYKIDKIHKESVYLYGNVVRPGEKELAKSRSLRDLFKDEISKVGLKGVFLGDTLFSYALIKSKTKNLDTEIKSFNLSNILNGKKDIKLNNDDEIYIFNKYNSSITPYITVHGIPIVNQGKYRYFNGIKISDILAQAGTISYFKDYSKIKVTTYNTKNYMPKISILTGKEAENFKLSPFDDIEVYDYYAQHHIKTIKISGEVNFPKKYSLNDHTTLKDAIKIAGGFTPKAYKSYFEVLRYYIKDNKREKKLINVPYDKLGTFELKDYDEITVHIIPNWRDRETVTVKGEVNFPGTYVIESGDKLSDIIKRAGGYTDKAFLEGAIFTRESIKKLQRQRLKQSIVELKQKAISLSVAPNEVGQGKTKVNFIELTNAIDKISAEAQSLQPIGRISIALNEDMDKFAKSRSNIVLKDKDTLTIPSKNDTILVVGEVMSPTAIVYESNDVNYYINKAGGLSSGAEKSGIYVVHANGSAERLSTGWFSDKTTHIVKRGDTIIVPKELVTLTGLQITKDISSIFYQFSLTAVAMHAVGAL
ncbi:MAG: SLBB domain-containing protein [Sulfurospirillum sp.]